MATSFGLDSCSADPGQPRIGWLCSYAPEELILAAGFVPVRINSGEEPPAGAETLLPANLCPFVRSHLERAASGRNDDLHGVLFVLSCDAMRRLADVWEAYIGGRFIYRLDVPRRKDALAERFLAEQFRGLLRALEAEAGRPVSDDDLARAVKTLNETRRLVRRISRLRISPDSPLTGTEFQRIVGAALSSDRGRFNEEARRFLSENEGASASADGRPRVLLGGCVADGPALVGLIEESGATVVAEDHCAGLKHFDGDVEESPEPLLALARRYLRRAACARMVDAGARKARLLNLVREYGAHGVVFHTLKFCDLVQSDLPGTRLALEEAGVPVLHLERDYTASSSGQLRTRCEAFAEILSKRAGGEK